MTPKPKILWVDDTFVNELHDVMSYEDELKYSGGFDIVKIAHVDEAVDILDKEETFVCIILDMMMPYGKQFKARETENGFKTGIVLAKKIQGMDKYAKVPIVLLTGVRNIYEALAKRNNSFPCYFKANISTVGFWKVIQKEINNQTGDNS